MTPDRPVLGINVSHDRSAVLALGDRVLCAIAEERLDRRKHSVAVAQDGSYLKMLPLRAIDYVLRETATALTDCAAIVAVGSVVYHPQKPLRNLTREDVLAQLPAGIDPARVEVVGHHLAHARGAGAAAPFTEAAVLVADGAGNLVPAAGRRRIPAVEHTSFYHARGRDLDLLQRVISAPRSLNSLGAMYQLVTEFIGFGAFQEGKTMGLAPYGTPDLLPQWRDAVTFPAALDYRIDPAFQTFDLRGRMIPRNFRRRFGTPRHHSEPLRKIDKDLAFAVQYTLEETLIRLATDLRRQTGSPRLVLAGGVALNSVANQKIVERAGYEQTFIVPCAADDGTALGAAVWPHFRAGGEKTWSMEHAFFGKTYAEQVMEQALAGQADAVTWMRPARLQRDTARRLAQGAIIGWFQGGAEIGPRALGHRSILCDPRRGEMKYLLNERVKYRESFRPFAPAVPLERAAEYFELAGESPFMLRVARVRRPPDIPAVTHLDGTGRVQTVTTRSDALFHGLLTAFGEETGTPVLLNTSFNLAGEPIVETPAEAVDCFLRSEMDALVLGPFLVEKRHPELSRRLARQVRELLETRRLAAEREAELEKIRQSRGWRLLSFLNRLRGH